MVVVSLMLEFFSVAEWRDNAVVGISLMLNYVGDIVVIFFDNSTGEEYWDVEDAVPYRCGGKVFRLSNKV